MFAAGDAEGTGHSGRSPHTHDDLVSIRPANRIPHTPASTRCRPRARSGGVVMIPYFNAARVHGGLQVARTRGFSLDLLADSTDRSRRFTMLAAPWPRHGAAPRLPTPTGAGGAPVAVNAKGSLMAAMRLAALYPTPRTPNSPNRQGPAHLRCVHVALRRAGRRRATSTPRCTSSTNARQGDEWWPGNTFAFNESIVVSH